MATGREALTGKQFTMPRERVDLPEWGEDEYVWVHGLTARQKNQHNASLMNQADWTVSPARAAVQNEMLLVRTVRDDDGNPVLTMDDIPAIGGWPCEVFDRLLDVANRLSGGSTTKAEDEQAVKN